MANPDKPSAQNDRVITCAAVARQIEARMAGTLAEVDLAAWAFDRFYAEELGTEQYQVGAEDVLADALDTLMFDDDPGFRLDEAALRELLARLTRL